MDLMSALDQIETDYEKKTGLKADNINVGINSGRQLRDRSNQSTAPSCQDVSRKVGAVRGRLSTPRRVSGKKNSPGKISVAENLDSFLDLSFTSPMEVNTPQVFKTKSSGLRMSSPKLGKAVILDVHDEDSPEMKSNTLSPMVTPRRSSRKKKRVMDEKDVDHIAKNSAANNSDFFQSLMENVSIDELDVLNEINKVPVEALSDKTGAKLLDVCIDKGSSNSNRSGITANSKKLNDNISGNLASDLKSSDRNNEIQPEDLPQIPTRSSSDVSLNQSKRLFEIKPSKLFLHTSLLFIGHTFNGL